MKLVLTLLLSSLFAMTAYATTVYETTDKKGNPEFTDLPVEGAKEVELPPLQTFPSQPASAATVKENMATTTTTGNETADQTYQSIAIVQPTIDDNTNTAGEPGATVRSNSGDMRVVVSVEPQLMQGDKLELLLDGNVAQTTSAGSTFNLTGVTPGKHTLVTQVVNQSGDVLIQSSSLTIYMHRSGYTDYDNTIYNGEHYPDRKDRRIDREAVTEKVKDNTLQQRPENIPSKIPDNIRPLNR